MLTRLVALSLGLAALAQSVEISWRSRLSFTSSNETSTGEPLDGSWAFHLVFFRNGFVPSMGNTENWCEHWTTLDVSIYSEFQNRFTGSWDDTGQIPFGTRGYIWGFNRGAAQPEWILMTASDWTWPIFANPMDPTGGIEWLAEEANFVVVGQVDQGGVHLTTAAVSGSPPTLGGDFWKQFHFSTAELAQPALSGWDADPDGDGVSKLAEFAFGLDPRSADKPCVQEELASGGFEFTVQKAEKVAVTYQAEVSSDLKIWQGGGSEVSLVAQTATSLTYRDLTTIAAGKRFGRVVVALAD